MDTMKLANQIHLELLAFLQDRKGFDYWWHEMEDDVKAEIEEEMIDIINRHLSSVYTRPSGTRARDAGR